MSDPSFLPAEEQLARLRRGAVDLIREDELLRKLKKSHKEGVPLRVKLGIDPSSPDIHLGHTVVLRKLREFQKLGHLPIVLWGTATAMVGDPTGRNKTRPPLTREQVEANKQTYRSQVDRVLDIEKSEERENGEWFTKLGFMEAVTLAGRYTLAQLLERDDFAKRYGEGLPISMHEMFYPLMQGHDSVELRADVELGGTDQLFNLMVGRELQRQAGQDPQCCITVPLLVGLDGTQKMSKSYGNYIGVTDAVTDMFGKCMSVPDDLMATWFTLVTDVPEAEIESLLAGHPREAKVRLAQSVVADYHGAEAADTALVDFNRVFQGGGLPSEIPEVVISSDQLRDGAVLVANALAASGICKTNSDGRRLVQGGGVKVDGEAVTDPRATLAAGSYLLQSGKRKAAQVTVPDA